MSIFTVSTCFGYFGFLESTSFTKNLYAFKTNNKTTYLCYMISLAILVKKNLLTQSNSHLKVETHEVNTHKSVHVTCAAGNGVLGNIKATGAHVQPKCNEVEVRFCA